MKRLKRYTTLPILLDYLERKKLVLLDPSKWEDKNDSEVIGSYKKKAKIKNLLALCFSYDDIETIHHWKTYANGTAGCCIEFDANMLLDIFEKTRGLRHQKVEYKKINELDKSIVFPIEQMPFVKRKAYECEKEYRIIWEGEEMQEFFEIDFPLDSINKITFSQQMPKKVFDTIKNMLRATFNNPQKKIYKSTLYENKTWINYFK